MGVDVYLKGRKKLRKVPCPCCEQLYDEIFQETFYHDHITHNLVPMALEAGVYQAIWKPFSLKPEYKKLNIEAKSYQEQEKFEEESVILAEEITVPLKLGLTRLESAPEHYKNFNSDNGWGVYEDFVPFVRDYLAACIKFPKSQIIASR